MRDIHKLIRMTSRLHNTQGDSSSFGERLRIQRKKLKLSQEALGVSIGLDESCSRIRISRYETGVHEPSISTSKRLANTLEVPLAYLYCEKDSIANIILLTHALTNNQLAEVAKYIRLLLQTGKTIDIDTNQINSKQ